MMHYQLPAESAKLAVTRKPCNSASSRDRQSCAVSPVRAMMWISIGPEPPMSPVWVGAVRRPPRGHSWYEAAPAWQRSPCLVGADAPHTRTLSAQVGSRSPAWAISPSVLLWRLCPRGRSAWCQSRVGSAGRAPRGTDQWPRAASRSQSRARPARHSRNGRSRSRQPPRALTLRRARHQGTDQAGWRRCGCGTRAPASARCRA